MPDQSRHITDRNAFAQAFGDSRETLDRLALYADLLRRWQKAVNLVSPSTLDDVWHRHFADSAQLVRLAPAGSAPWLDLGSGAGFPGLVVAIMLASAERPSPSRGGAGGGGKADSRESGLAPSSQPSLQGGRAQRDAESEPRPPRPAWRQGGAPAPGERAGSRAPLVHLVESDARKCAFLHEVRRFTGAPVEIHNLRIEQLAKHNTIPRVAVVTARALASLDKLLGYAAPFFATGTIGLFLKGRDAERELEAARKSWRLTAELVPSLTDCTGRIAVIKEFEPLKEACAP